MRAISEFVALIVVLIWPIIPLWWIPVHGANRFVKKLGFAVYPVVFLAWILVSYPIYANRDCLLRTRIDLAGPWLAVGMFCIIAGTFLQLWTLKLLTARGITGIPEIFGKTRAKLVVSGPFSYIRHPTYLSHTLFFLGIFLSTGVVATGIVALIDFIAVNLIIIPMEEKELLQRFGNEYRIYMDCVPRLIPRWKK